MVFVFYLLVLVNLCFLSSTLLYKKNNINLNKLSPDRSLTELAGQLSKLILSTGRKYFEGDFIIHLTLPTKHNKILQVMGEMAQKLGRNCVILTNDSYCCDTFEDFDFFIDEKKILLQHIPHVYVIPAIKPGANLQYFKAQMQAFNNEDFFNPTATFFLILLTDQCQFNYSNETTEYFNYMWKYNKMSVVVLVWSTCDLELIVVTAQPFSKQNQCRTVLKEEISILQGDSDISIHNKHLRNFNKCRFVVATAPMRPYVWGNLIKDGNKSCFEYVGGIDIELLRLFSNKYNFTYTFDQSNGYKSSAWFRVLPNGDGAGIIWNILGLKTDLAFGGVMPSQRNYYKIDYSISYESTSLSWFVTDAGFSPQWKIFFGTFSILVWVLSSITFFVAGLLYCYMDNFTLANLKLSFNIKKVPILNLFSVALSQSSTLEPRSNFARILFVALNMFSLHLTIAYSSLLFILITNPPLEKEIVTVEDLHKSGVKVCSNALYLGVFKTVSLDNLTRSILVNSFECPDLRKSVTQLVQNRNFSLMERPENVMSLIDTKQSKVHSIVDKAFSSSVTMMASRGNPLSPGLSKIAQRSFQSGLVLKWKKDAKPNFTSAKTTGKKSENNVSPLSYNTLKGCFYILIGGQMISCIVFLAELVLYFSKRNK